MPYRLPPGDLWTDILITRGLAAAWEEEPRSPAASAFLNSIEELLDNHAEKRALQWRGMTFSRRDERGLRRYSLPEILRENGISRPTFEKRWRRAVRKLAHALNESRGALAQNDNTYDLDRDKTGTGN